MNLARPLFASLFVFAAACGDDSESTGSGGSGSTSTASSGASTSASGATTTSSTGSDTTSTGQGGDASSTTGSAQGGGGSGGDTGGSGGSGGSGVDCDAIPAGPFEPTLFSDAFGGSEDIAFDGLGNLAGKSGSDMLLVDAEGIETILAEGIPSAYGTRYRSDGSLVVALPAVGRVIAIDPDGNESDLAEGLNGPNGIHVGFDDVVWVTELPAGRIQRIVPGQGTQVFLGSGQAPAVNGIYVDEGRGIVFFTDYGAGELWRVDVAGAEDPVLVAPIAGAALDGLTMDVCGNIYAVDQGNALVYRVRTDAAGDAVGEPELIADLPSGVANAQFGRGPGFASTVLYAAGNPGDVYAIDVGVAGAAQAGPP